MYAVVLVKPLDQVRLVGDAAGGHFGGLQLGLGNDTKVAVHIPAVKFLSKSALRTSARILTLTLCLRMSDVVKVLKSQNGLSQWMIMFIYFVNTNHKLHYMDKAITVLDSYCWVVFLFVFYFDFIWHACFILSWVLRQFFFLIKNIAYCCKNIYQDKMVLGSVQVLHTIFSFHEIY